MANSKNAEDFHAIHVRLSNGVDGWVYFIDGGELVKIGWSNAPRRRLKVLQPASPIKLRLLTGHPGNAHTEGHLHRQFKKYRSHGEWFVKSEELLAYIAGVLERHGPTPWIKKRGPRGKQERTMWCYHD